MNGFTQNKLNLSPRTEQELRGVLASFEQKWQNKARLHRFGHDDNAVRH
jgi:hypothetical protein